eukprot:m.18634 g.18634  ORF g.18634 m.18634 type:complete len:259 (+) comp27699_c0_seq1:496-1272(+)
MQATIRNSLVLVLSLIVSFEGSVFSANFHRRVKKNQNEERHPKSTPTATGIVAATKSVSTKAIDNMKEPSLTTKDKCFVCGRQLDSLTKFCSEEREIYGFPLSIFNHTTPGRYEVNIVKDNTKNERVGQVVFPKFFRDRFAMCQCWNVAFNGQHPVTKWPVRLAFGFPPNGKEDMVTSISRLMKKVDSLLCPESKSQKRVKFYLAEAKALRDGLIRDDGEEVMKLVKTGIKEEIVRSSSVTQKTVEKSHKLALVSQQA